jgi:hypothetical protein
LAHRVNDREYELIELKFGTEENSGSDHPLFAAFEVVQYGLMYLLFRRRHFEQLESHHHLLRANRVRLIVLAPARWYSFKRRGDPVLTPFRFGWLADQLSEGLQAYTRSHGIELDLRVEFQTLSESFLANYDSLLGSIQKFREDAFNSRLTLFGDVNS